MDEKLLVGERIKKLRMNRGYTISNLALLINTSRATLYRIEKGINLPSPFIRISLSKVFNVSPDIFLSGIYSDPYSDRIGELMDLIEKLSKRVEKLENLLHNNG